MEFLAVYCSCAIQQYYKNQVRTDSICTYMIYPVAPKGCRFGNILFAIASAYNHSKNAKVPFGIPWDSHPILVTIKDLLNKKDFNIIDLPKSIVSQNPVYGSKLNTKPSTTFRCGGITMLWGGSIIFEDTKEDIKKLYKPFTKPTVKGTLGIHIRLGDYLNLNKRYNVLNVPLLAHALTKTENRDIHLFSDDIDKAKKMLYEALQRIGTEATVVVHRGTYLEDFADLTSMEELILSTSTYSWWVGYLSHAKNIVIHADWMKTLYPSEADLIFEPTWKRVYFSEIDPVYKKKMAIIFIGLGKYIMFWRRFYYTLNKYFCTGVEKHFFVFSDADPALFVEKNVTYIKWKKRGWPHDTECRFKCILSIADKLTSYDYVCFANANIYATKPIVPDEVLPRFGFESWSCMLHQTHDTTEPENLPVDKQYNSTAFMRAGWCKKYLQGAFYIATPHAMLDMAQTCQRMLEVNTENGYTATWHDESYFNKYIANYPKRLLGKNIIKAEELIENEDDTPPLVLVDKQKCGGHTYMRS